MSRYKRWKSFERFVASKFREAGWEEAKRNFGEQFEAQCGKDILNTEPFVLQCKCGKRPNPIKAYDEAKEEAKQGEIPVAVVRYTNRKKKPKTFVLLSFQDFIWLIGK